MPKKLTLKNYFLLSIPTDDGKEIKIESLQDWLSKLLLHGKESRFRTRFLKLIVERVTELEQERIKMAEENSEKNRKGEIIYLDKDKKETTDKAKGKEFKFKKDNKFNEQWRKYLEEDLILDVTPETTETIYGVRDILLSTKEEFTGAMALRYSELCDSFEEIK